MEIKDTPSSSSSHRMRVDTLLGVCLYFTNRCLLAQRNYLVLPRPILISGAQT